MISVPPCTIRTASPSTNGKGEQLWRPLNNPRDLQVSTFADLNPPASIDAAREELLCLLMISKSRFERRQACGSSRSAIGRGIRRLFEIPTKEEIHDNIAAFWRPKQPVAPRTSITSRTGFTGAGAPKSDSLASLRGLESAAARRQPSCSC